MKKMILVPIDFSEASQNAYLYATKIAQSIGAGIELLHVIDDTALADDDAKKAAQFQETEYYLNTFARINSPQASGGIALELDRKVTVDTGNVLKSILRHSRQNAISMIIMGATGTHAAVNGALGQTAFEVSQQSQSIVLLVPKAFKFVKLEQILYVSDYEAVDKDIVNRMVCFSRKFYADLNFLHIDQQADSSKDYRLIKKQLFLQLPYFGRKPSFKIGSTKNNSILKGIEDYALGKGIDLIVLLSQERNYLEMLMKKSLTEDIVERLYLPVLIYHHNTRTNTYEDSCLNGKQYASMLN